MKNSNSINSVIIEKIDINGIELIMILIISKFRK